MAKQMNLKVSGVWKKITRPFLKVGGVWKYCKVWLKVSGVWKLITPQPYFLNTITTGSQHLINTNKVVNFIVGTKIQAKFIIDTQTSSQGVITPLLRYDYSSKVTRLGFGISSGIFEVNIYVGSDTTQRMFYFAFPATDGGDAIENGDECILDIEFLSTTQLKARIRNNGTYDYEFTVIQDVNTITTGNNPVDYVIGNSNMYIGYLFNGTSDCRAFKRKLYYLSITGARDASNNSTSLLYDFYGDEGTSTPTDKTSGTKGTIYNSGIIGQE